jgi:hypothetical protein
VRRHRDERGGAQVDKGRPHLTMNFASRGDAVPRTDASTLTVFRWAQIGMVVGNLARIPVFSTGDREAPLAVNEILLGAIIVVALIGAAHRRSLRVDSVAVAAALFALVGAGSAVWTAQQ